MNAHLLVVAKAPISGFSKTRLAATVGNDQAAELAAAALLDTLAAGVEGFPPERRHVSLAGDLTQAVRSGDLLHALNGWQVRPQCEGDFGVRLAHAHAQVPGPVVQIGMDTPQVGAADLQAIVDRLRSCDAVLGPADDGGWWVLGLHDPQHASCLTDVPMSTSSTATATRDALTARGLDVAWGERLDDVDTAEDADVVAERFPDTGFAQRWAALRSGVRSGERA